MFNKVYLGATPIKKIYLGDVPIKYGSEPEEIIIPDNAIAVYTVAPSDPLQLSPTSVTGKADDWSETGWRNKDGSYTIIITASEAPSKISFSGNTALLSVEYIDTTNLTTVYEMFYACYSLKTVNMPDCNSSKITSLNSMFYSCTNLISVDMRNWNLYANITNITTLNMFCNCTSLQELRLDNCSNALVGKIIASTNFPTFPIGDSHYIYCTESYKGSYIPEGWTAIYLSNLLVKYEFMNDDGEGTTADLHPMITGGSNIVYTDEISGQYTTRTYRCKGERPTGLVLNHWSLVQVIDINPIGLKSLRFGGNYLEEVSSKRLGSNTIEDMYYLFANCINLQYVKCYDGDSDVLCNSIDCSYASSGLLYAFRDCQSLKSVYLTNIYKECAMTNEEKWSIDLGSTLIHDYALSIIISQLPDLIKDKGLSNTDQIYIRLPRNNTLKETQVQVAIDKGWTVENTTY